MIWDSIRLSYAWLRQYGRHYWRRDDGRVNTPANGSPRTDDATRMKSEYLSGMGHEMRTQLNTIIGLSHLALKNELAPRQRNYLRKIHGSGQRLLGIINDILDFSSIEAGQLDLEDCEFALRKLFDSVIAQLGEKAHDKNLELIVSVNPAIPAALRGDPLRLGQILTNYVSNAIQFTPSGQICMVVYPLLESEDSITLQFDVRDTGSGVPHGGTGLSLAISRSLAELMHGSAGVESALGKGSNFWFTARLGKVPASVSGSPHPTDSVNVALLSQLAQLAHLHGQKVLVVDDNEHARLVLHDMLNDLQLEVESVDGGHAALAELVQATATLQPYALVLLDWQMPDMDGIEVARRIGALHLALPPRMIMVTAFGRQEVLRVAQDAGIDDVLIKPVCADALAESVARALSGIASPAPVPPIQEIP